MKNRILHLVSFVLYFVVVGLFYFNNLIEQDIIVSKYAPIFLLCVIVLIFKMHIFVDIMLLSALLSGSVGCMLYSMNNVSLIPMISLIETVVLIAGLIVALVLQVLYNKKYAK